MDTVIINRNDNKVIIDSKSYDLIFSASTQIGDSSCFDRGIRHYVLFDNTNNHHYLLSVNYDTYINEHGECDEDLSNWTFKSLPLKY